MRWFSDQPTGYYHELTDAFLHGHLHLARKPDPRLLALSDPYDPAANEACRVNDLSYFRGHYYLYHGAVPALVLFAPVKLLTGRYLSEAGASFVFTLVGVAAALLLLLSIRRRVFPDSSTVLVASCAIVLALGQGYHVVLRAGTINQVPIASAYCFLMLALLCLWRALQPEPHPLRWLALASLGYGLAIASRPNYVFGGAMLLVPVFAWWRDGSFRLSPRLLRQALAACAPVALVVGALLAYNAARFHHPFEFGARYMLGAWDQRIMPSLGFGNFCANAYYYFIAPVNYHVVFPFVTAPSWQTTGLLWHTPFVWLMLLLRVACWLATPANGVRTRQFIFALCWIGGANLVSLLLLPSGNPTAVLTSANARYVLDFQPTLVLLASLCTLGAGEYFALRAWPRRFLATATLLLALLSAGAALSLDFQRYPLETYRPLARLLGRPAWWWEQAHGIKYGPVELQVALPADKIGAYEPLLTTGTTESGDLVFIFYEGSGQIRIGLVGTGTPGPLSESITVDYTQPHRFEFHLGSLYPQVSHPAMAGYGETQVASLKRRLVVRLDGQSVLEAPVYFHPASPDSLKTGEAPFLRDYSAPKFSGRILAERRLPFPTPFTSKVAPDYGAVKLDLRFPTGQNGRTEPLIATGIPQAGDMLSVAYQDDRAVRFIFDHWGHRGVTTDWLSVDFTVPHVLEVCFGSLLPTESQNLRERLRIILDGKTVLDLVQPAYESSPYDVVIGRNMIGSSTAGYAFTGVITEAIRLPVPAAKVR
ncbi:MAG: hypothetical protein EXS42_09755 [Lacunisphaera sp.]|nr:hypothetical protein [Lacunisphaera sp.]